MVGLRFFQRSRALYTWVKTTTRAKRYYESLAKASAALDARDWDKAGRHYAEVVANEQADAAEWVQYGHALKEAGNFPGAERAYQWAITQEPHAPDPYRQLGFMLKRLDRHDEAAALFLKGLSTSSVEADFRAELVTYGFEGVKLEVALIAAGLSVGGPSHTEERAAIRRVANPAFSAHLAAAGTASRDGRWPDAASHYQNAIDLSPCRSDLLIQLGHALKEGGDLSGAERAYRKAISWSPFNADAYLHLGHQQKLATLRDQATLFYATAWRLSPGLPDAARELREYAAWKQDKIEGLITSTWGLPGDPDNVLAAPPPVLVRAAPANDVFEDASRFLIPPSLHGREQEIWTELALALAHEN